MGEYRKLAGRSLGPRVVSGLQGIDPHRQTHPPCQRCFPPCRRDTTIPGTSSQAVNTMHRLTSMLLALCLCSTALGQVPHLINYQGRLSAAGDAVDDELELTFRLYTVPEAGTELWAETHYVTVEGGMFSVLLGSITPLMPQVVGSDPLYLEMQVTGDGVMLPRHRLASVPFALVSESAAMASDVAHGSITADKLAPMGASSGQVLKYSGGSWYPAEDDIGAATPNTVIVVRDEIGGSPTIEGGVGEPVSVSWDAKDHFYRLDLGRYEYTSRGFAVMAQMLDVTGFVQVFGISGDIGIRLFTPGLSVTTGSFQVVIYMF